MGSGEKKVRREVQRVLHKFLLRDDSGDYPVHDHPDARDMIIEYAEPVEGLFESLLTRYSVAVFSWNLSLLPEDRRNELIDEFISPLMGENGEGRDAITELILALVARRIDLYPDETFLILPMDEDPEPGDAQGDEDEDDEDDYDDSEFEGSDYENADYSNLTEDDMERFEYESSGYDDDDFNDGSDEDDDDDE